MLGRRRVWAAPSKDSRNPYRTQPLPITGNPPGISFIIGNEAAERFSRVVDRLDATVQSGSGLSST